MCLRLRLFWDFIIPKYLCLWVFRGNFLFIRLITALQPVVVDETSYIPNYRMTSIQLHWEIENYSPIVIILLLVQKVGICLVSWSMRSWILFTDRISDTSLFRDEVESRPSPGSDSCFLLWKRFYRSVSSSFVSLRDLTNCQRI